MRKSYKAIGCISLLGFVAWISLPNSTPFQHQRVSLEPGIPSPPPMAMNVSPKAVHGERKDKKPASQITEYKRIPADQGEKFYKYSQPDPFNAYPKTQISGRYAVINGLVASFQKSPSVIRSIGGLHFYEESQFQGGHVVVYDKSQEKYAMWSGELIIEASDKYIEELVEKFDLEVVSKSPGRIIFKAGPDFSLSTDLQSVEKSMGIDSLSLDLKYSKLMRQ